MSHHHPTYDIYDDTGRDYNPHQPSITVMEPADPEQPPDPISNLDELRAMHRRAQHDIQQIFPPFAAPDMFSSMRAIMGSFDHIFDDPFTDFPSPHLPTARTHYLYESQTRTVAPDGTVREETVRTAPGEDGRPRTKRTVREGEVSGDACVGRVPDFHPMFAQQQHHHHHHAHALPGLHGPPMHEHRFQHARGHRGNDVQIYEIDDNDHGLDDGMRESWARRKLRSWTGRR